MSHLHTSVLGTSKHRRVLSITRNTSVFPTLESSHAVTLPGLNVGDVPFTSPLKASSVSSKHHTVNNIDNSPSDETPEGIIDTVERTHDKNNQILGKQMSINNVNTTLELRHSRTTPNDISSPKNDANKLELQEDILNIIDSVTNMDQNTNSAKKYLHNLLRYINYNNATLHHDQDGDLHFYLNRMPEEEKKLVFKDWVLYKKDMLNDSFNKRVATKTSILKDTLQR